MSPPQAPRGGFCGGGGRSHLPSPRPATPRAASGAEVRGARRRTWGGGGCETAEGARWDEGGGASTLACLGQQKAKVPGGREGEGGRSACLGAATPPARLTHQLGSQTGGRRSLPLSWREGKEWVAAPQKSKETPKPSPLRPHEGPDPTPAGPPSPEESSSGSFPPKSIPVRSPVGVGKERGSRPPPASCLPTAPSKAGEGGGQPPLGQGALPSGRPSPPAGADALCRRRPSRGPALPLPRIRGG